MSFQSALPVQGGQAGYGRDGRGLDRALGALPVLAVTLLSLAGCVAIAESSPFVGVLLGAPALIYVIFCCADTVEQATSRVDTDAAETLARLGRELGAPEAVKVLVWDKGCGITMPNATALRSHPAFMRGSSLAELRGAVAVRLSERESTDLHRIRRLKNAVIFVAVLLSMTVTPFLVREPYWLAAFAPSGMLVFLFVLASAIPTHTTRYLRLYGAVDRVAAARAGDMAAVQAGLRALDAAERDARVRAGRLGRLLLRLASPVHPNAHYAERADQLGSPDIGVA
ncbi:MAG: hypothetical protein ACYDA6_04880 [Solirubrobacteraceae bacterium]